MEINCSFQRIVGGQCSQDKRSQAKEKDSLILPLLSCGRDICAHAQSVGVTDVQSEIDLILARASMFTAPDEISRMTIRPAHRSSLGIGWRRGSQRCRVPEKISSHAHGNRVRLTVESIRRFQSPFLNVRAYLFQLALVSLRSFDNL